MAELEGGIMINREDAIQELMDIFNEYQNRHEHLKKIFENSIKEDINDADKEELWDIIIDDIWWRELHDDIGEVLDKIGVDI